MWLSPHNHRNRNWNTLPCSLAALCAVIAAGCTSLPTFSASQRTRESTETPAPVFDSEEPIDVAAHGPIRRLVEAPRPFAWKTIGQSAGGRNIQSVSIGRGGYRVIIVGSLAGYDPVALRLADQLVRHIHNNQIILGGVEVTVIRNLNPDGEASRQMENSDGAYLNRHFVTDSSGPQNTDSPPEVRCLRRVLEEKRPQRVIHLRTIRRDTGLIAASEGSMAVASDLASWLNLRVVPLPGNSSAGTLEHYLSAKQTCEIVTVAVPARTDTATTWETYGDSLLNLLLADDYESRKLVRTRRTPTAADRRNSKAANSK